jgi:hypothetical protein
LGKKKTFRVFYKPQKVSILALANRVIVFITVLTISPDRRLSTPLQTILRLEDRGRFVNRLIVSVGPA